MVAFTLEKFGGNTVRLKLNDLLDPANQPVDDATVTIKLYDEDDVLVSTGTINQGTDPNDNDYYADITLPVVTRVKMYKAVVDADKASNSFVDEGIIWVKPV